MSARSLNKVLLIGNLTRDPELRYTPQGTAVCSFGVATNRQWTTEGGEKREEAEFHRIVAWNKLAELCTQLLTKGRKVFVEGRLQTRSWQAPDGTQKTATEIVIDDMIILDSRRLVGEEAPAGIIAPTTTAPVAAAVQPASVEEEPGKKKKKKEEASPAEVKEENQENQEINPDDIPF